MNRQFPSKPKQSHKGESGIVTIVGGSSRYYGAPLICALGAEAGGADLINLFLPQEHIEAAKTYSLNFFLKPFVAPNSMGLRDIGLITHDANNSHCICIGPGLGSDADTLRSISVILSEIQTPAVVDANALTPLLLNSNRSCPILITPHHGEFLRLFGEPATPTSIKAQARKHELFILVKGSTDYLASPDDFFINETGCSQMRVGGTGDGLAGVISAFVSVNGFSFDCIAAAVELYGLAGERLSKRQNTFTALELIKEFRNITL